MIEQILYMNLDRRPDRNEWFLTEMEAAGVPMDIVERVPAKDWQDYPDSESLLDAIHVDGFGQKIKMAEERNTLFHQGMWAFFWSYCCCLKKIMESRKNTLLIQDDVALQVPWKSLLSSLKTLSDIPWRAIQLEWGDRSDVRPNICVPFERDPIKWSYGIRAISDKAVIYNRWGAEFLYTLMQGCETVLNGAERSLYMYFNNYHTFHATNGSEFIKQGRFSSDLRPTRERD